MQKTYQVSKNRMAEGIFIALLSSSLFGLIPFFSISLMQDGIGKSTILFYRFLFSTIIMGVYCILKKQDIRLLSVKTFGNLSILGISFALTSLLLIASYSLIPSGMATTIHFLYPILVAAIMIMFFKERKSLSIIGFSLLAFFGIGLLSWSNGHIDRLGLISAFLSIITYSIYMVGIKKMSLDKSSPEIIAFYVLFIGTVIFFVSALCTTGLKLPNNIQAWLYLVVLAIFPTVIADLLLIYAINKYTGPTISSALGVMEPVVIVIIGSLFLSESLSLRGVLGIMLILSSVIMVIIKSSKGQSY